MSGPGLDDRFHAHLDAAGWLRGAKTAVVGVSGGLDSMTLLYLMRSAGDVSGVSVRAAHLDHRMRAHSGDDAAWVQRICDEWGVAFHLRTAAEPVGSEAEGRELRYAFFEEVRLGAGAGAVTMTGHTADDQAETVLFRIARGSGPRGLRGVHPRRPPSLIRPLLPFWRRELEAFAADRGIPSREDPSNRDQRWTRNRLRHHILPALEEAVPGAAAALVSLAGTSRLESDALDELLDQGIDRLTVAARPCAPEHPAPPADPSPLHLDREAPAAASPPALPPSRGGPCPLPPPPSSPPPPAAPSHGLAAAPDKPPPTICCASCGGPRAAAGSRWPEASSSNIVLANSASGAGKTTAPSPWVKGLRSCASTPSPARRLLPAGTGGPTWPGVPHPAAASPWWRASCPAWYRSRF